MDTSNGTDSQLLTQGKAARHGWCPDGGLTPLESQMVAKAETGELVDHGEGPFSLAEMQAWPEEWTVRAAVLRHLLVGEQWTVDMKGVRLRGVRISGLLDLDAATLRCPLMLDMCYLEAGEPACLSFANASHISLARCQLAGLTGRKFTAKELDLSGSTLTGPLQLVGADIGGELICTGAKLNGRDHDGNAMVAGSMKTGGTVRLDGAFTAAGAVRLVGADIGGHLNCSGAKLNGKNDDGNALAADGLKVGGSVFLDGAFTAAGAVRLGDADIHGQLICHGAKLNGKNNDGNALAAFSLTVGDTVFLDGAFTAAGTVQLGDADIGGNLVCSGAELNGKNDDGDALAADGVKVGGSVFLDGAFTAAGTVQLGDADIGGNLVCSGAKLNGKNDDGDALAADGLTVGGVVFLDGEFTAAGKVQLGGADIGDDLVCSGAELNGNNDGDALAAVEAQIRGSVFFDAGFTAAGAVRLVGADIRRDFNCSGAELNGMGNALVADNVKIGGNVVLGTGLTAAGTISFNSAHVDGSMKLVPAAMAGAYKFALTAAGANIKGKLLWAPQSQISGHVNLEAAKVGELEDNWRGERRKTGYWPTDGRLRLDGFTYSRFSGDQQATVKQRLDWIRSQYQQLLGISWMGYVCQPYQQLANVYWKAGQDTEARKVAIARRIDLRTYANLNPYRKVGNWLLEKTIKYGYQSWRAGAGLAVLYGAIWLLVTIAQHTHGIMPVGNIKGLDPVPTATTCTSNYPCFAPAGYAVDIVIPIINVNQDQYWGPNGQAWGYAWVTGIWVASVLGWILVTLLVAGLTGLTRRQD